MSRSKVQVSRLRLPIRDIKNSMHWRVISYGKMCMSPCVCACISAECACEWLCAICHKYGAYMCCTETCVCGMPVNVQSHAHSCSPHSLFNVPHAHIHVRNRIGGRTEPMEKIPCTRACISTFHIHNAQAHTRQLEH